MAENASRLQKFQAKKQSIVNELSRPSEDYTDDSPKGSVDEAIRPLIEEINALPSYVTTSSCSGRIAMFLEGQPKQKTGDAVESSEQSANPSSTAGGKGGGEWLYTSHDPVSIDHLTDPGSLFQLLGLPSNEKPSFPEPGARPQYIHFKFEPMILHLLTASPHDAQTALAAALAAGFRESGLTSLLDRHATPTPPMVGIRTMGLGLDSIVAFKDASTGKVVPMVEEGYLRVLVGVANERFVGNGERIARLREGLVGGNGKGGWKEGWEDKEVRRERKRREGLAEREVQGKASKGDRKGAGDDVDMELGVDELMN